MKGEFVVECTRGIIEGAIEKINKFDERIRNIEFVLDGTRDFIEDIMKRLSYKNSDKINELEGKIKDLECVLIGTLEKINESTKKIDKILSMMDSNSEFLNEKKKQDEEASEFDWEGSLKRLFNEILSKE